MTPMQIKLAIYGCIALSALTFAYWLGGQGARADLAEYKTAVAERATSVANAATKASELARKSEQAHAAAIAAIADKYEKDKLDAQAAHDRDVADLTSDKLRLRAHWQGCKATAELSGSATRAAIADAAEQLRRTDTADLIGIGREADAKERALQEVIRADRK